MITHIEDLEAIAAKVRAEDEAFEEVISVCTGTACIAVGSDKLLEGIKGEIAKCGLDRCKAKGVGCKGLCSKGPLVNLDKKGELYEGFTPDEAEAFVKAVSEKKSYESRLADANSHFFTKQKKIVLENSGVIDPENIEEYIARGGYEALLKAIIEMSPNGVVDEVRNSGLRGRGGGGYPTGLKWQTVAKSVGSQKYVVCNGDEGDPGAFMDRSVMEADPHRIIEGMAIAGYAIGADMGYLYVRAEYPLAVKMLKKAIKDAERCGLLGKNIAGTNFSFSLDVRLGAGAFVCGEETALIASIEGKRGMPRPRPPFPAMKGLFGKPTLINNVESFANIAPIIRHGASYLNSIGTEKSKGTKVFALTGNIVNAGIVEVPMGMSLREIVFDIGGGIASGKKFKAVQTGGPSGGCIPAEHLDLPVDYDSLISIGSMMGSGGMIVMDEGSNMVDVARFFMEFCMSESCGKCVPCRVGTVQMYNLLGKIIDGKADGCDMDRLEKLCYTVKNTSLCGLGQSAPNPILSTMKFFRTEYMAFEACER
jgi:bidirectional [NiFe] hydrogenase diaphorase subunit